MIYSPVFEMLVKYEQQNMERFHMPGHKGGEILFGGLGAELVKFDVTELDKTDNLLNPKGAFLEAQLLLAKKAKSYKSFIITDGATCGNQAMILGLVGEGEKIIVDRNCHISVFSALTISGAVPTYIESGFACDSGILACPSAESAEKAAKENPDAKAMFITSPNSFGQVAPISEIAKVCKKYNMLLLVDEAHGAHFPFSSLLPKSATEEGADASVVSYHKTMPSLTQSAVLNVKNAEICEKIEGALHMLMTSSSSFLLVASVDWARAYMEEYGEEKIESLIKIIEDNSGDNILPCGDKLRITAIIDGEKYISHFREKNIEPEMYGKGYMVFIVTVADSEEKVLRLLNVLKEIPKTDYAQPKIPMGDIKLSPREAFMSEGEKINIKNSVARILKEAVYAYPPGVPLVAPGEALTKEAADYMLNNNLFGAENNTIFVTKKRG